MDTTLTKLQTALIKCLKLLNLPEDNVIYAITALKTVEQQEMMLTWIEKHHKEKPSQKMIMDEIIAIKEYKE